MSSKFPRLKGLIIQLLDLTNVIGQTWPNSEVKMSYFAGLLAGIQKTVLLNDVKQYNERYFNPNCNKAFDDLN